MKAQLGLWVRYLLVGVWLLLAMQWVAKYQADSDLVSALSAVCFMYVAMTQLWIAVDRAIDQAPKRAAGKGAMPDSRSRQT